MNHSPIEISQLKLEYVIDDGFLGMGFTTVYRNQYVAYLGNTIIARSNEWKVRTSDFGGTTLDQQKASERMTREKETAYQEVFQKLIADGWEPIGTDDQGRFMSFKRATNQSGLLSQLERLAQLKAQGLITEEEFTLAKARLLIP